MHAKNALESIIWNQGVRFLYADFLVTTQDRDIVISGFGRITIFMVGQTKSTQSLCSPANLPDNLLGDRFCMKLNIVLVA